MFFRSLYLLLAATLFAGDASASKEDFLFKASAALDQKDKASAQFWLTREVAGNASFDADAGTEAVLKRLRLAPKGFIPDAWPPSVRKWFIERGRSMWTVEADRVHENEMRFEVASSTDGEYFATLTAVPELQMWYRIEEGLSTSRELLIAGAGNPAPILAFGIVQSRTERSQPTSITRLFSLRALHHVLAPEFRDLNGDGVPEVILKMTWLVSNGFRQTLRVYRIRDGAQLELWKTFDSPTGSLIRLDEAGEPQQMKAEEVTNAHEAAFLD